MHDLGPDPLVVLVCVSLLDRKSNNTHARCTPWNWEDEVGIYDDVVTYEGVRALCCKGLDKL